MIFGNIHYKTNCTSLDVKVQECLDYAYAHNLSQFEPGSHPIRGNDLYVNIASYETTDADKRFWEAHKAYLDLHLMLDGCERIDLNFLDNMEMKPYVEKDDFVPAVGPKKASVILQIDDFLVCYPEDVHMTGIQVAEPLKIKKAIFKIKL